MPDVEKSVKMAAKRCHHRMVDDQPKEGGWGIIVVLAGHINMALTMGLQRCCGVLYFSWRNEFETSAQETATVQSLLSAFSCFSVFLGGLLTKRYGSRISGMVGGFVITTGLFCSCWVTDIKQLYVTAIVIGVGLGISFNSMIVAVATHFKTRYKTAHAVAYSGMGTGIMALPPLLQLLLEHYGWRGAVMIFSAIMANIMACGALYRLPADRKSGLDGRQREQHIAGVSEGDDDELGWNEAVGKELEVEASLGTSEDLLKTLPELEDANGGIEKYTALNEGEKLNSMACLWKKMSSSVGLDVFVKSYRFTLLCLMQTELNMPYTAFIQFIIPRAESTGVAPSTAAFLISILGIGGLLGRLGNGLLISWKVSAEGVITACFALASLSSLLPTLDGYAWLAVASFVQGFTIGAFHAIQIVLIRRYVGLSRLVLSTGLCHIIVGIGVLSGPVIAGWLFDVTASYKAVFYVLTGVYVVCTLQMLLIPLLKRLEPGITVQPWDE